MSQSNEYFSSTEIKRIDEHKRFTAERYLKTTDYNPTAKELPQKGKEFFDSGTQQSATKRKSTLGQKLRKRVSQGTAKAATTSVATTVAAAVGGVVALSTIFAPTPTIDLPQLDVGHNYVSYTIVAEDLQEDMYYFVEIASPYDSYTNDIVEGENQNTVEGLRQGMEYDLTVKGVDATEQQQTTTTYFKKTFYTSFEEVAPPEPPYIPPEPPVVTPETTFALAENLRLTAQNMYSIDYSLENVPDGELFINQLTFYAQYDGQPEMELECFYPALDGTGSYAIEVPWGTSTIDVYAITTITTSEGEQTYQTQPITYTLDTTPQLQLLGTKAHLHNSDYNNTIEVELDFAYSAPDDANVIVQDVSSASVTDAIYTWYNGSLDIVLGQTDNGTLHTFSYYLADGEGHQLTTPQTVTVDSSVTGAWDSFNYLNPTSVTKTYVKHGDNYLENLYIDVQFASSDPDVYYQIVHAGYGDEAVYNTNQPIAVIENVVEPTWLIYNICKDVDGVTYVLYNVAPSGDTASEPYFSSDITEHETGYTVTIRLPDYMPFETDNIQVTVQFEDGTLQTVDIDASQIVANPDYYAYEFTVETQQLPLTIWMSVGIAPSYNDYDTISTQIEMVGTPYKYQEYLIYGG